MRQMNVVIHDILHLIATETQCFPVHPSARLFHGNFTFPTSLRNVAYILHTITQLLQ